MSNPQFDVIVIGGGCTGAGMARDCAMRGLRTLLIERGDICSETTGTCAGMISGGVKYLLEPKMVAMCARESLTIWHIAKNIMFRTPILWLITDRRMKKMARGMVLAYSDYLSMREGGKIYHVSKEQVEEMEPRISHPKLSGAVYFEELFVDPWRLTLHNVISAHQYGATVRTYSEVIDLLKDGDTITGVVIRDRHSKRVEEITARFVVNGVGPWVPKICRMAGIDYELRLNKGAHIIFDRRVTNIGIVCKAFEGRNCYMFPHENTTILGVTAIDVFGEVDQIKPEYSDVEYLLHSIESVMPSIRKHRVIRSFVGVRPMLYKYGVEEGEVTRNFKVVDHEKKNGIKGFITIAGGKLVIYRQMAQKATDLICKRLGIEAECRTHLEPLPGAVGEVDVDRFAEQYKMDHHVVKRLIIRHGPGVEKIFSIIKNEPSMRSSKCTCESGTEAEIKYCIQNEWACHLNDLRRRLRLGSGPCQGTACTARGITTLVNEREMDPNEANIEILDFLQERWKGIWPALRGSQVREMELKNAIYGCVANFNHPAIKKGTRRDYKT